MLEHEIKSALIAHMTESGWSNVVSFIESCDGDELIELVAYFMTQEFEVTQ